MPERERLLTSHPPTAGALPPMSVACRSSLSISGSIPGLSAPEAILALQPAASERAIQQPDQILGLAEKAQTATGGEIVDDPRRTDRPVLGPEHGGDIHRAADGRATFAWIVHGHTHVCRTSCVRPQWCIRYTMMTYFGL